jgi:GTPase SAR1 family protein
MTNPSSLNSIETWLEEIRENTANDSVLALIGNKKDLLDFEGSNLKARKFAETHKLHYYETSALWDRSSADGIETIMLDFVYEMIKDMPEIENGSQNEEEEDMETVEEDFDEKGGVEEFKNFKAKMKGKEEIWKRFSLERMKKEKEVVSLSIDRKGGCLKKNDECSC